MRQAVALVFHYIAIFSRNVRRNPSLAAITVEGFFTRFGFGMVGLAIPLYALHLGMSIVEIGLLFSVRSVATILFKPLMGIVADRLGRKRVLVASVSLRTLVGLLLVFATLPWHLFAIRILHGVMTAARDPSAMALIAEHSNKQSIASAFAWYLTARDLGRSLGYMAAGILIQADGYIVVFLVAFFTSAMALITVSRYVRESREIAESKSISPAQATPVTQQPDGTVTMARSRPAYWKFLPYAGFGLMIALTAGMMRGLFPVIVVQHAHLSAAEVGLIVGVSSIVILIAGPLFAWLSDHVSRKLVLSVRSICNTLSSIIYIFFPNFPGFLTGSLLDDTGKAAFRPTWGAVLAELSAEHPAYRARTMSIVDTSTNLGEALGPLLAAYLIAWWSIPVMLAVRAGLAIFTELQALVVFKKNNRKLIGTL